MPNYTKFIMRHGESTAQIIIEQIERNEGISGRQYDLLEHRWEALMKTVANDAQSQERDN